MVDGGDAVARLLFKPCSGQDVVTDAELIQATENRLPIRTPEKSRRSAGSG